MEILIGTTQLQSQTVDALLHLRNTGHSDEAAERPTLPGAVKRLTRQWCFRLPASYDFGLLRRHHVQEGRPGGLHVRETQKGCTTGQYVGNVTLNAVGDACDVDEQKLPAFR